LTTWHILGAFLLLASIINSGLLRKFLSTKYARFLGKISFSLYLIHILFLFSFSSFLFYIIHPHMPYGIAVLTVFLVSIGPLIILANLYAKYVDNNGMRFARFFEVNVNLIAAKLKKKIIR
jgi:peptidoglycan/LPS O-acetylase OafA/YrhL